jgi:molecular chaperone GrpE
MGKHKVNENKLVSGNEADESREAEAIEKSASDEQDNLAAEVQEMNNKYLRLYAEFENYKKRVNRDKEEIIKYGNENLLYDLLPFIDHLDLALKHASNDVSSGLVQGVEITLKELRKTLEKFGLTEIEAEGKPFDPMVHHAMSQVEREDIDENIVVEDFRKGYMLKDKVLRPSLVAVSAKPKDSEKEGTEEEINTTNIAEEEL